MSNAIKYGQPASDIRVHCSRVNGEVIISVMNEGKPIVADDPDSEAAQAFRQVASNIAAQVSILAFQQQQLTQRGAGAPLPLFRRR